jgi:hypothetical protein
VCVCVCLCVCMCVCVCVCVCVCKSPACHCVYYALMWVRTRLHTHPRLLALHVCYSVCVHACECAHAFSLTRAFLRCTSAIVCVCLCVCVCACMWVRTRLHTHPRLHALHICYGGLGLTLLPLPLLLGAWICCAYVCGSKMLQCCRMVVYMGIRGRVWIQCLRSKQMSKRCFIAAGCLDLLCVCVWECYHVTVSSAGVWLKWHRQMAVTKWSQNKKQEYGFLVEEFCGIRFKSDSSSLINVGSGFHCLRCVSTPIQVENFIKAAIAHYKPNAKAPSS